MTRTMFTPDYKNRLLAVVEIFSGDHPPRRKLDLLKTAIRNINPVLDEKLDHCCHAWDHLDKLRDGKITEVVVENLPEGSEAEKKRKQKARLLLRFYKNLESGNFADITADFLPEDSEEEKERKRKFFLFLRLWRDLEGEVKRLQAESNQLDQSSSAVQQATVLSRVVGLAKGPLGLITVLAAGVVLAGNFLNQNAVEVVLVNQGCATIYPQVQMPVSLPGLKIPRDPIPDGGHSRLTLPPLNLTVDYTDPRRAKITAYGLSVTIEALAPGVETVFDGTGLVGKKTEIKLSERKTHELRLLCAATTKTTRSRP